MDTCVICNTTEDLVDSVVTKDLDGNQVILKLCDTHSETTTPKQAKMAHEVRRDIQTIIDKASAVGLALEIPTVVCAGMTMTDVRTEQTVRRSAPVQAAPRPVRTAPTNHDANEDEMVPAVTVARADGKEVAVPKSLTDRSKVVYTSTTNDVLQKRMKATQVNGISEASFSSGYDIRDCPFCKGNGTVKKSPTEEVPCPKCGGSGMF